MYLQTAGHCRIIMDELYEEYRDYYSHQFSDEIEDKTNSLDTMSMLETDDYLHHAPMSELLDISGPCVFVSLRFFVDKYH